MLCWHSSVLELMFQNTELDYQQSMGRLTNVITGKLGNLLTFYEPTLPHILPGNLEQWGNFNHSPLCIAWGVFRYIFEKCPILPSSEFEVLPNWNISILTELLFSISQNDFTALILPQHRAGLSQAEISKTRKKFWSWLFQTSLN